MLQVLLNSLRRLLAVVPQTEHTLSRWCGGPPGHRPNSPSAGPQSPRRDGSSLPGALGHDGPGPLRASYNRNHMCSCFIWLALMSEGSALDCLGWHFVGCLSMTNACCNCAPAARQIHFSWPCPSCYVPPALRIRAVSLVALLVVILNWQRVNPHALLCCRSPPGSPVCSAGEGVAQ